MSKAWWSTRDFTRPLAEEPEATCVTLQHGTPSWSSAQGLATTRPPFTPEAGTSRGTPSRVLIRTMPAGTGLVAAGRFGALGGSVTGEVVCFQAQTPSVFSASQCHSFHWLLPVTSWIVRNPAGARQAGSRGGCAAIHARAAASAAERPALVRGNSPPARCELPVRSLSGAPSWPSMRRTLWGRAFATATSASRSR